MPGRLANIPGYDLATWWFPHQAVGGDYCDVLPLRCGGTGLVIADVSGHGIGPSLIMASTRAALRALILEHSAPEVLLNLLVEALAGDFDKGHFITMVIAVLDGQTHTLRYANAGHAPALHYVKREDRFLTLPATGLPVGIEHSPCYPAAPPRALAVGDIIVLCTDGIVEAMDANDEPFGLGRLEAVVRQYAAAPMAELVLRTGERVERHYVGDDPADDLMILVARRNE